MGECSLVPGAASSWPSKSKEREERKRKKNEGTRLAGVVLANPPSLPLLGLVFFFFGWVKFSPLPLFGGGGGGGGESEGKREVA